MYFFARSWDIGAQSDRPILVNSIIPEFQRLRNGIQFSYLWKEHPNDAYTQVGPFPIAPDTAKVDERCSGTQIALLIEAPTVTVGLEMLAGTEAISYGHDIGYIAVGYPNGGTAIGEISGATTIDGYPVGALYDTDQFGTHVLTIALFGAPTNAVFVLAFTDANGIAQSLASSGNYQSTANGYGIWQWTLTDSPFVAGDNYAISTGSFATVQVLGVDFRMGVWQSLATPHGKRLAGASRGSTINTNNP
jgi:hypothetical protein